MSLKKMQLFFEFQESFSSRMFFPFLYQQPILFLIMALELVFSFIFEEPIDEYFWDY